MSIPYSEKINKKTKVIADAPVIVLIDLKISLPGSIFYIQILTGFKRKMQKKISLMFVLAIAAAAANAGNVLYQCSFAPGKWQASEWQIVKSPRWFHIGSWEQQNDHISNKVPKGATEKEMLGKLAGKTYTSMLLKQKFSGNITISAMMSFDHRMAPLLVITPDYGKDLKGNPEHREHFEIVLYDKGLNVWHHYYSNGKPHWRKAAFLQAEFKPKQKYTLTVKLNFTKRGPMMTISCGGKTFGYLDDTLPKIFYIGLTGCEGINRFYDFKVLK